jgi:hypothetical protein
MISKIIKEICRAALGGLLFLSATIALAQSNKFQKLQPEIIKQRLEQYSGSDSIREATLKKLFRDAGCSTEFIKEYPVRKSKAPNVSCTLPGNDEEVIIIGAHFDHVDEGNGVVDNWSGASLLPSLFQSIHSFPRRHTFVFIGFAAEEKGMLGSKAYVAGLSPEEIARIRGMIDIDTLGLGPTEIWVSNSDPTLVKDLYATASTMKLPVSGMNVDGAGDSDGHSFKDRKIPIITLHSVTAETIRVLHSPRDKISSIKLNDYYDSYSLIAAYLVMLDSTLDPN